MTYNVTTLANGLRIATEELPSVESVAVAVSVGVGARYESEAENGVSHFLEHMAFKGTTTRSARDIAEAFDSIGGHFNAYTSNEMTVYYAKVLKDKVEVAVDILADIMQNSIFAEDELNREKGVIIQEIAMHHDSPDDLVTDYFDETAFTDQPLGRTILGTAEKIANYTRDDLRKYMASYYRPKNIVVTAAGNIKHADFLKMVEQYFNLSSAEEHQKCEPANYQGGDKRVEGDFEQLHLHLGLPAVSYNSPDYYTMQIYSTILGGGMSSRLFQEVREKRGLAYTVYASGTAYSDAGVMNLYAATAPEKAGELSQVLCEQIVGMVKDISDAEIARAKNQQKSELLMARENPQTVAAWIGRHLLIFGRYRPASEIIEKIEAVNKEKLLEFATKIAGGKLTIAALGDHSALRSHQELSDILYQLHTEI